MSQFSRRAMAYTIAIGVAGIVAEGINYLQGTPPTGADWRWLLLWVEICGGVAVTGLAIDLAIWLWRRGPRFPN